MREIIFRGRRNPASDFVCGHLIRYKNEAYILTANEVSWNLTNNQLIQSNLEPVDPETVGQYTGVDDKNGKPIFEGDIVQDIIGRKKAVEFYKGRYYPFIAFPEFNCWCNDECEVIGNIHDNPELLKHKLT